jgi:hypothetical protein
LEDYITFSLYGQTYNFKFESDTLSGAEVADILLSEINNVESQSKNSVQTNKFIVLILAALNITLEKIEMKNNYLKKIDKFCYRSDKLIQKLDECIVPLTKKISQLENN